MIMVYGKPDCTFCEQAKLLLDSQNIGYEYKELDKDFTKEELLKLNPNARSFPQIFDDGRLIGGFSDLGTHLMNCWDRADRRKEP